MIELTLPAGSEVLGSLHELHGREDLDQDILFVKLPSGIGVDVGWYPQDDPSGSFLIRVVKDGNWDSPVEQFHARDVMDVLERVEELASKYAAVTPVLKT